MRAGGDGRFYITTAIPYVNAAPHIGHALEFVQTDVIARANRLMGREVLLLTGADENSLKNVKAAEEQKITTQQLCDRNAAYFMELAQKMNLSFGVFMRSSLREAHWPGVQRLWQLCDGAGDIYRKKYSGLYCVGCEQFYTEGELVGGLCPEHKTKPEPVEEENYFFRLSKYQDALQKLIEEDRLRVWPQSRKNEVLGFIRGGLEDFSISRSVARARGWGVPVPGDSSQIMYVWLDALSIYMTGVGYGTSDKEFGKWWPTDVHVIGKGIIRFHAVYWPAILLSAGIDLPKSVFVHGYLTVEGEKMSKSIGNVVSPLALLGKYTADELRYYLIRDIPTFEDGDFSEAALKDRVNKELLGDLGNLVNRVLTIVEKSGFTDFSGKNELGGMLDADAVVGALGAMELHNALGMIMEFVRACNRYVNDKAPWKLDGEELRGVLYNLLEAMRIVSVLMYPFIPETSEKIAGKLGTRITGFAECRFRESFTERTAKGEHLFKKIE